LIKYTLSSEDEIFGNIIKVRSIKKKFLIN